MVYSLNRLRRRPQIKEDLKNDDNLKNEDNLNNEDDLKNEDDIKNGYAEVCVKKNNKHNCEEGKEKKILHPSLFLL